MFIILKLFVVSYMFLNNVDFVWTSSRVFKCKCFVFIYLPTDADAAD